MHHLNSDGSQVTALLQQEGDKTIAGEAMSLTVHYSNALEECSQATDQTEVFQRDHMCLANVAGD